ncbi:MAG: hypothetical protein HKL85_03380 [Acidimicrobiaceae bacterium]|nr:hypothetical protein [Acidimicrobiaceae bacterium]
MEPTECDKSTKRVISHREVDPRVAGSTSEQLCNFVGIRNFDQEHFATTVDTGPTVEAPSRDYEEGQGEEAGPKSGESRPAGTSKAKSTTAATKSVKFSAPWLLVLAANIVVAANYPAIVAANRAGLTNPSQGSLMLIKPWHFSVAALTFLRGDLWIRYASIIFLAAAAALYLLKDSGRAPSWLRQHRTVVHRATFFFGLAISFPMLITGILWGSSIAVTLAIIALVLVLVVSFLSIA